MASIIKTDNIQNTCGANIIKQCGTTVTLGASGDSVVLGAGATASGFGRSGGVNYCTTAKTTPFTAANGSGYFVNTTCGAVTVTLPASPSAGAIIALKDYGGTWQTNNVTLCNNGSKINGVASAAKLSTQSQSVTLIYVDATKGWQDINDSTSSVTGEAYITATGGTITTCGDYKIHTFTADGTFCVSAGIGSIAKVDYLVVAGGGSGGYRSYGGGGGAGGFRVSNGWGIPAPTMSPLSACVASLPVSIQAYPVTVGAGGAGACSPSPAGNPGSNSVFSTITSTGGGRGGGGCNPQVGSTGGSGGGPQSVSAPAGPKPATSGNTPPVSPPQGNDSGAGGTPCGAGTKYGGGGGGGAGAVGTSGNTTGPTAGSGGAGSFISPLFAVACAGTPGPTPAVRYFAGGGGGANDANQPYTLTPSTGAGGVGGGGAGATPNYFLQSGPDKNRTAVAGTANTGGGGGAGAYCGTNNPSASGGSGIVIIRYKFQ